MFEKLPKKDVASCVNFLVDLMKIVIVIRPYWNRLHHKTFMDISKFLFKNRKKELCNSDIFGKML